MASWKVIQLFIVEALDGPQNASALFLQIKGQ